MNFNPGDLVIRKSGGNKMRIFSCNDHYVDCIWFTETQHRESFDVDDIVSMDEYDRMLNGEKRDDIINDILYR